MKRFESSIASRFGFVINEDSLVERFSPTFRIEKKHSGGLPMASHIGGYSAAALIFASCLAGNFAKAADLGGDCCADLEV